MQEANFAINILGGNVKETFSFELPEDAGERQMIVIDKRRQTSKNTQGNQVRQTNLHYLRAKKRHTI